MKNLTDQQVIKLIDGLCLLHEDGNPRDIENTKNILNQIYRIAHSHSRKASCYKVHTDWRKEARKTYDSLKPNYI